LCTGAEKERKRESGKASSTTEWFKPIPIAIGSHSHVCGWYVILIINPSGVELGRDCLQRSL